MTVWVASLPGAYDADTVDVLSWDSSVAIAWIFMVPVVTLALFELRLAAACWRRRSWVDVGVGLHLVAAAGLVLVNLPGLG